MIKPMTAIFVRCPACAASPGKRCKTPGGSEMKVSHHVRTALASRDAGRALTGRERLQLQGYGLPTEKP